MNDVIFAGFAQFSYLNWHKLSNSSKNKNLKDIFEDKDAFDKIKRKIHEKYEGNPNYCKQIIDNKNIYDISDGRLFYLYSEHPTNPNNSPKYPEFGSWEFVCAYDHTKIYNEMPFFEQIMSQQKGITYSEKIKEINKCESGFAASVFKKNYDIMISYRGTDLNTKLETISDFTGSNIPNGLFDQISDQMSCAIYVYKQIIAKYSTRNYNIHITGHSLGGLLAQFTYVYSGGIHKSRCWNALGVGDKFILPISNDRKNLIVKIFKKNYDISNNNNIINYSMSNDFVGNLWKKVGTTFIVDKNKADSIRNLGNIHSLCNFIPFLDNNGNINIDRKLSYNFLMNSFKDIISSMSVKPKVIKGSNSTPLGDLYLKSIKNEKNLLKHCINNSFNNKVENGKKYKEWYDSNTLEVGKFNNIDVIAGVSGGLPIKLEEKKSYTFKDITEKILPDKDYNKNNNFYDCCYYALERADKGSNT